MTTFTREEIKIAAAEGRILDLIFRDSWRHDQSTLSKVLVSAHLSREIDLRTVLPLPDPFPLPNHDFYQGMEVLLPALSAIAISCVDLLELLAGAILHDDPMISPAVFPALMNWCKASSDRPTELLQLIEAGAPLSDRFHCLQVCLSAGLTFDLAFFTAKGIEFLLKGDSQQRAQAARALSSLPIESLPTDAEFTNTISGAVDDEIEPPVRDALLFLALAWLKNAPGDMQQPLLNLVERAASPMRLESKKAAAQSLLAGSETYSDQVRCRLLAVVASGRAEDEIVHLLDLILYKFVKAGDVTLARDAVEKQMAADPTLTLDRFDSLVHELESECNDTGLSEWVVAWLHSGSPRLCLSLRGALLRGREGRSFTFDFAQTPEILASEYPFIARKAIGTFFTTPLYAASLIVCLMRNAAGTTLTELEHLLYDPVLINYSALGSDYLGAIAADPADPASQPVQRVLGGLRGYLDGLGEAFIRELSPSERQRQLELYRRNEKMQTEIVEARKASPLSSLFNEKILLHGIGMASWIPEYPRAKGEVNDQAPPMRRMEQTLATIQHTFQLPRQSVLDPTTLEFTVLAYLLETRSS